MARIENAMTLYPEDRFARKARDQLADDAHPRQNHDVNGGMGVEPEQMLEQQGSPQAGDRICPRQSPRSESHQKKRDGQDRRGQDQDDARGIGLPIRTRGA